MFLITISAAEFVIFFLWHSLLKSKEKILGTLVAIILYYDWVIITYAIHDDWKPGDIWSKWSCQQNEWTFTIPGEQGNNKSRQASTRPVLLNLDYSNTELTQALWGKHQTNPNQDHPTKKMHCRRPSRWWNKTYPSNVVSWIGFCNRKRN